MDQLKRRSAYAFILLLTGVVVALSYGSSNSESMHLIDLQEDNWRLMLKGEWMVEFYAPWCPACKNLAPTWERFATIAHEVDVNVAKIDVTTSPSLSGRFFVTALPTIYHVKNGEFRQYRGSRDGDALMFFIKQKQWQKLDPLSPWKKPDTIHMSILSYFFKLSHTLKDFNANLQEEYGLPSWGSYALFAVGTIFVGAALGLMLVCIVDFLYPPKKSHRQSFSDPKRNFDNTIEDIVNDEIEDDEEGSDNDEPESEHDDENDTNGEDDQNDDVNLNEIAKNDSSSEAEKQSEDNDSEFAKGDEKANKQGNDEENTVTKLSPTEVRKRKPRKAD